MMQSYFNSYKYFFQRALTNFSYICCTYWVRMPNRESGDVDIHKLSIKTGAAPAAVIPFSNYRKCIFKVEPLCLS